MSECKHCQNGYFPGSETECVNGVLIDIDEAHEGWRRDVCYPLAPCHPEFGKPEEDQVNDSQERLAAWAALGAESEEEAPLLTRAEAATLAGLRAGTLRAVPVDLLRQAHAAMRACGWQLAPADIQSEDGVIEAAVAEIEERFAAMLAGSQEGARDE